jgi:hypothetical protein
LPGVHGVLKSVVTLAVTFGRNKEERAY